MKIEVKTDAGKLGTLLVSKGNIEWLPAGNSVNKKRMSWTKFAQLIEAEGQAVKGEKKAGLTFGARDAGGLSASLTPPARARVASPALSVAH